MTTMNCKLKVKLTTLTSTIIMIGSLRKEKQNIHLICYDLYILTPNMKLEMTFFVGCPEETISNLTQQS